MKTLLLIVVLLLGGMPALYARFKRVLSEGSNPQEDDATQRYGSAEGRDDIFDFDNVDVEETVPTQQGYFTYEAPEAKTSVSASPVMQSVVENEQPQTIFDLRQAVIYQTLLNNRYLNLEK